VLDLQVRIESLLADGQSHSLEQMAEELGTDSPEPVFWILRHLCANDSAYAVQGSWGQPASLTVARAV
jgi:glucose-6-phosphate isomerase